MKTGRSLSMRPAPEITLTGRWQLMIRGKVKWFNDTKGFGFIETEGDEDIFVHRTALTNAWAGLYTDQEVEFDIKQGDRGLVALNVKTVN